MATELYFDTARLGRMCPGARKAEQDFSKLASQLGSSLYWDRFLATGFDSLPTSLQARLPGLRPWGGVTALRNSLANLVTLPSCGSTFLAGQSGTLATLGGQLLFHRCKTVLATDLDWPPYLAILRRIAIANGRSLHVSQVRRLVLEGGLDDIGLIERLAHDYERHQCDGVFLSDIATTGVRMPLERLIAAFQAIERPRAIVIDGAQALNHRPLQLAKLPVDLYLSGVHKWLGGYHPLRVGFVSRDSDEVSAILRQLIARRHVSDPLHEFCAALEGASMMRFGETVNVTPLLTTAGALDYWRQHPLAADERWRVRCENRLRFLNENVSETATTFHDSLAAGIALVRLGNRGSDPRVAANLRPMLAGMGIVASEPLRGLARFSMPCEPLPDSAVERVKVSFRRITRSQAPAPARADQDALDSAVIRNRTLAS